MKKLAYFIISLLLLSGSVTAQGQKRLLKGEVRNRDGLLPGVTITEKGVPTNATQTDEKGQFSIEIATSVIVVSYAGYIPQDIDVQDQNTLDITLSEDNKIMDNVVVVGFGKTSKKTLTGSVSSVSGDEIRQSPSPSLQNNLAGRVTGFSSQQRSGRPGADAAAFYVRGISSYTGNNQPLIIVDDIEFTYQQFFALNANEIESISILKDAATTSIYGIKGANGVVLVTTIRGRAGRPTISFQSEYGLSQPTRLPPYLNAYESAKLYTEAQMNSNALKPNDDFVPRFSAEDLELYRNGSDPYGHPDNDWYDILLKDFAPMLRNNLNVTGGTARAKYFVSLGYVNQGGQLKDFGVDLNSAYYYKRYNYRSNIDLKVTSDLDVQFNIFGYLDETNDNNASANSNLFSDLSRNNETAPYNYPVYNPDGSLGYSLWQRNFAGRNNNNIVGRLMYNGYYRPFSNNINLGTNVTQRLNFITPGLSIKGTLAYRNHYSYARYLNRPSSGSGFPSYIYDPKTGTYSFGRSDNTYRITTPTLRYDVGSTNSALTLQAILNYARTFGRDHNVTGLFLYNQNSKVGPNSSNGGIYNFIPENFKGYTARVGYDYKNKYLVEVSGAYNGTDRFAKDRRYGFFPAASVGWNIAEEKAIKENLSFLNLFKLRGSYGLTGVDNTGGVYAYLQNYTLGSGSGMFGIANNNGHVTAAEGTLANNEVTWEKEKKMDIGFDLAMFNRKLTATVAYFNNNRFDILTTRGTVSAVFGQGLPNVNLGKTNNKGLEFELGYNNRIGNDWRYSFRATYSSAKNKILFKDEPIPLYPYQQETGQPIGARKKYSWTGEFYTAADLANPDVPKPAVGGRPGDIKYRDLNGDDIINEADQSYFGLTNQPNKVYGLNLGLGYKNLQLSVLFQGASDFVASATGAVIHHNVSKLLPIHQQHWTPELGNSAKYPQLYIEDLTSSPANYYSDFWAIPGDYIRLKSAEISYTISAEALKRIRIKEMRVYANGYNLLTWTKLDRLYDLDPEVVESVTDLPYPPSRTFNFGLNITF
ncbi:SusC/RagA family TonB-linked outer membrane protein [Niabella sp. 22666]|uniref:SusC/RagA family TonB-linked outer membrane protein n=1 Tax=Niabella sp. 22666 TaxID=3453954 RepID=UPI003F82D98D